jgi:hypothetical protein
MMHAHIPIISHAKYAALAAVCLAAVMATGCRTVTPEERYHFHATLLDAATGQPVAGARVAAALERVVDPDTASDQKLAAGRTDAGGSATLVIRQTGGEVTVGMWHEYEPPVPPSLEKLFLYVWRGERWQRIVLELDPSVEEKSMPGHRWIDVGALKLAAPSRAPSSPAKEVPPPPKAGPAPIAPTPGKDAPPPPKDVPAPPATAPAKASPAMPKIGPAPIAPTPPPPA